jgi:DNA-3-methyladenine glycosylase II
VTTDHTLIPRGRFSLRAAAEFGFGPNEGRPPPYDGAMRLAFAVDGAQGYAGAVLRQPGGDDATVEVQLELSGGAEQEAALAQVARIVSLDHDGEQFAAVGERDPVIGRLQATLPGQRPVLFHSPYEACAWSIISARRPASQSARVQTSIAQAHGASFDLAGVVLHAFPQPGRLAALPDDTQGLNAPKIERLRAIARAALDGELDVARLHALGPERAYLDVQRLKGIGPFYASLVVLRASGFADAMLELAEPKVLGHAARFYDLDAPPSLERFAEMAEVWRPFRTWCTVLIRLAGERARSNPRT